MSPRPRLEVAEIVRSYGQSYRERYRPSPAQSRVLRAVAQCRTGILGGHVQACDHCGERQISYNSCRNRHCPKCQGSQTARWLEAQQPHLLPVPYFHVVFTLPQVLGPLALQNPRVVYGLLFQAVSRTLLDVAANPRHLGATIGFLAVLHTWGQTLTHHPHIHCVVPAGGLSPDGSRWVSSSPHFFLPVRVLSRLFRGKFLARYTHRVAISNHRLQSMEDGAVRFRYKDYARGRRPRSMRLEATEFIRRFLLHALPKGFVRIRRYGLLANAQCAERLALCRELLAGLKGRDPIEGSSTEITSYESEAYRCPTCEKGIMRRLHGPIPWAALRARPPPRLVSS